MSEKESSNTIFVGKDDISDIIGCYELINHLSNEEEFIKFRTKYYSDWSDNELLESYIWAIASIYDYFCELIISINPFFDQPFDIKLNRGYYYNVYYTEFCSNFLQGRIIYFIYNFLKNKVFKVTTIKDLFASLLKLKDKIFPLYILLKEFNLGYKKKYVFMIIENLVWPISGPTIKTRDFFFIQSHFFNDIIDYLNFFKKENGLWISSKGFFFAIAFALNLLLGDEFFGKKENLINLKDIPFNDFSMDENGLLFKFSLNAKEVNHEVSDTIHFYSTPEGDLPLYELISSKIKNYREKISDLYNILRETLPEEEKVNVDLKSFIELVSNAIYGKSDKELVEISKDKLKIIIEYLEKFSKFKEVYTIANIFDFEDVYSISHLNQTHNNAFFKIISDGILSFLNNRNWKDSIRLMVFHRIINNSEKKMNESDIEIITPESSLYFLNNPFDLDENLLFGIYLEVPTGSMINKDQTFWIGTPFYGDNKTLPTLNLENFQELTNFCEKYKKKLEIKSYLVNEQTFEILQRNPKMTFDQPSPFNYIFESGRQIEDFIQLNRYRKVYQEFLISFGEGKVPNSVKGAVLEKLADRLFNLIPGFRVVGTDVETEAEEIDLIIEVNSMFMDVLEMLGSIFIVECKNWKDKIGAPHISSFIEKLNVKNLRGGIIISKEGITGRSQDDDARRKIRDLINRGKVILTLEKEDLEEIFNGVNPLYLIRKSYYDIYFKGLKS